MMIRLRNSRGLGFRLLLSLALVIGTMPDHSQGIRCWNCRGKQNCKTDSTRCESNGKEFNMCTEKKNDPRHNFSRGCGGRTDGQGCNSDGTCFCNGRDYCFGGDPDPPAPPPPPPPPSPPPPPPPAPVPVKPGPVDPTDPPPLVPGPVDPTDPDQTQPLPGPPSEVSSTTSKPRHPTIGTPYKETSSGHSTQSSSLSSLMTLVLLMIALTYFGSIRGLATF